MTNQNRGVARWKVNENDLQATRLHFFGLALAGLRKDFWDTSYRELCESFEGYALMLFIVRSWCQMDGKRGV